MWEMLFQGGAFARQNGSKEKLDGGGGGSRAGGRVGAEHGHELGADAERLGGHL